MNSGVSGMQQYQQDMDVIGNNIANINTAGYKGARANFADTFSQTLRAGTTQSSAMQVGSGVATSSIENDFSHGINETTGKATDLAVDNEGFFMVKDPATGSVYATRAGNFKISNDGYLTTQNGLRVQGYSDTTLTTTGDIKIDNTDNGTTPHAYMDPPANTTAAPLKSYTIDTDGKVHVTLNDGSGTNYVRGQILLQNFASPSNLTKEGNSLYSGLAAAGPLSSMSAPNTQGLGSIVSGALESSNVDLTAELTRMITTQRAFQASSKTVTTSDEMLQEIINIKR